MKRREKWDEQKHEEEKKGITKSDEEREKKIEERGSQCT